VLHLKAGQPACRVLAVDDQPENRELIVEMLAPIGFEIRTAADGAEAVTRCAEWLPQIVLMDLRMPVLDGYEATRRIRAAHGAAVKLIVLSAFAFAEDDQRASAAGADAFLSKPFQETKLLDLIQQLVGVEYVNGDAVS
jgi:CheY-like chemotaxis protein